MQEVGTQNTGICDPARILQGLGRDRDGERERICRGAPAACSGRAPCHSHASGGTRECKSPIRTVVPLHCELRGGPERKKEDLQDVYLYLKTEQSTQNKNRHFILTPLVIELKYLSHLYQYMLAYADFSETLLLKSSCQMLL